MSKKPYSIYLSSDIAEQLKKFGDGNLSQGTTRLAQSLLEDDSTDTLFREFRRLISRMENKFGVDADVIVVDRSESLMGGAEREALAKAARIARENAEMEEQLAKDFPEYDPDDPLA